MTNIEPLKQEVHDLRNLLMGAMHALEEVAREAHAPHVRNIAETALGEIIERQQSPAQPEKPKPQTFREGHPVYVCRQCSKQYKEHGLDEECPVGKQKREVKAK